MPLNLQNSRLEMSRKEIDGNDAWVGTSKGLGWAIGSGYYKGLTPSPEIVAAEGSGNAAEAKPELSTE